jgi:uncharacterized phage protein (TIGR02218 family)
MRILSAAMQGLLNSDSISGLSTFWRLTRKDGTILGFTDYDYPVTVGSITYQAASGFSRGALEARSDLSVANFDATAILTSSAITEADIRAGKYDSATVGVWLAVATDASFATFGTIPLPGAFLGEIRLQDGVWIAELLGLSYALSQGFIEVCTPTCTADLFDQRCKVNSADFTDSSSVLSVVIPQLQFTIATEALRFTAGSFDTGSTTPPYAYGILTWTSGANKGVGCEVKLAFFDGNDQFNIQLYLQTPSAISSNDAFTITTGCDKTEGTCLVIYNNLNNMRGFPGTPGLNFLFDYGEAAAP